MEKNSFIFYHSWGDAFEEMSDEDAGKMIKTMISYSKSGAVGKLKTALKMAFSFIKVQMDMDAEKYEKTCEKRRSSGSKGGRPKQEKKAKKANAFKDDDENQMLLKKAKKPEDEDEYEDEYEYIHSKECVILGGTPTLSEVEEYCRASGIDIDVKAFFYHYESLGWRTASGANIVDWKAKARYWHADDVKKKKPRSGFKGRDDTMYGANLFTPIDQLEV